MTRALGSDDFPRQLRMAWLDFFLTFIFSIGAGTSTFAVLRVVPRSLLGALLASGEAHAAPTAGSIAAHPATALAPTELHVRLHESLD